MITRILRVSRKDPDHEIIQEAASIIRNGELVAFPTETVYGLGADALNANAVEKIFQAKRRPSDNPLIVHVASKDQLSRVAVDVPDIAHPLIDKFWPGPLTLVFKRAPEVPSNVCRGLPTVAVRMPSDLVALELIKAAGTPIAAPSANLSGRPSPTTAEHVLQDFDGLIPLILDAGPCPVGVESTVIDLQTMPPRVLRPGGLPVEAILDIIPDLQVPPARMGVSEGIVASPGMKYRHYSPECRLILFVGDSMRVQEEVDHFISGMLERGEHESKKQRMRVICLHPREHFHDHESLVQHLGPELLDIQKGLFRVLRSLDEDGIEMAAIESVSEKGEGLAIMNRLYKAAHEVRFVGESSTNQASD